MIFLGVDGGVLAVDPAVDVFHVPGTEPPFKIAVFPFVVGHSPVAGAFDVFLAALVVSILVDQGAGEILLGTERAITNVNPVPPEAVASGLTRSVHPTIILGAKREGEIVFPEDIVD